MSNLGTVLKDEITRLARKQLRTDTDALRKTVSIQRTEIAALKRRLSDLERAFKGAARSQRAAAAAPEAPATADRRVRFTAAGLAANRKRLGLSAADFGRLVGTTGQSIYAWEGGSATPRAKNLAAIAELRSLGKKAVAARLAALSQE